MEGPKFTTPEQGYNYPTEGKLLMDDLLDQIGLSREELHKLPATKKRQVIDQIKAIYQSPEVQNILLSRDSGGLRAPEAQQIREAIGIDKWNKLSEIVSYVKTLLGDKSVEERKQIFEKHLAFGVDVNEIQHTLTAINDVMPARIDTDIKHQSSMFYRAVVEVASNALDASIKHRSPIGRFGVGFYQILNHLKDPKDKVVVRTKTAKSSIGAKVEFKNKNGEIVIKVTEDDSISEHGTTVELTSKEFEAEKAEKIINEYFSHTQDAELVINGKQLDRWKPNGGAELPKNTPTIDIKVEDGKCTITDKGIGMDPRVIFEKLLVPKLSDKPPVYELREGGKIPPKIYYEKSSTNTEHKSGIFIQVGGIVIEKAETEGTSIVDTLVIDLPPSTILGEQRDQIEVNQDTIEALKNAIDQAMALPRPDCFQVINSLGKVCRKFQDRSKLYEKGDNIYVYLQDRVREVFSDINFLPNKSEFLELDLRLDEGKVAFLDTEIYQSPIDLVSSLNKVPQWSSQENIPLYEANFKEGSVIGIIKNSNYIIIDKRANVGDNPVIANKAIELAAGYGKGSILDSSLSGKSREEKEIKSFEDIEELVSEQWESLSFTSREFALKQAQEYKNKNPQVAKEFTKKVLSNLSTSVAVEAWDILHWYISADTRDVSVQLAEIDLLSKNINILLSDHKLAGIIRANGTPIVSMLEAYKANIPHHLERMQDGYDRDEYKSEIVIDDEKYYRLKKENNSVLVRYISEKGKFVDLRGSGDIVFRNDEITVFSDRIVNTSTNEVVKFDQPIETSWGTISLEKNNDGAKKYIFSCADILKNDSQDIGVKRNWEFRVTPNNPTLFINGIESIDIDEFKKSVGIGENIKFSNVLSTESGEFLFTFDNLRAGHDERRRVDTYALLEGEEQESFYITNKEGVIIWKFEPSQWPDKIFVHKDYSYSKYDDKAFIEKTLKQNAQCLPILYDRPILETDPVVKIVKYYFVGRARYRETLAYVNAKGEVTKISEIKEVNALTLDAKYCSEASCPCCGILGRDTGGFTKGYMGEPFLKGSDKSPIEYKIKIPVIITGEFKQDVETGYWLADANNGTFTAIFDRDGNFLRAEKKGLTLESITGNDRRDQKKHLQYRIPDRLRKIDTRYKDMRDWSYDEEIRKLITVRDQAVLSGEVCEANNSERGLLDTNKGELTLEHVEILKKYLLKHTVLDKEKLERIVYRVIEYRNIPLEDLQFLLPVLYESDYIAPNFFTEKMIGLLKQVSYLDSDRFIKLFEIIKGSVPDDDNKKNIVANKIIKFYSEKLQSESNEECNNLVSALSHVREYSNNILCDGFTLIKFGISVPASEVPRSLRPFLTFIQREEDELAYKDIGTIKVPEGTPQTVRLSEIIQWKRLRESEARGYKGDGNLEDSVHKVTHGKSREHILREITHAVHFQALNSTDLYVRELIQNAVDVMQSADMKKSDRNLEITVSANDSNELVTSFKDPVGMDIHTILNYFLVPGESTKMDRSKGYIGFYGQGVYTLFKNLKELNIKTGTGDGKVWYLKIKPIVEHDMVNDVSIDFYPTLEDFKGTVISKTQDAKNPYIEAAYVKDAVMTLTSALTDDRAAISYQGEKINSKYKVLSARTNKELGKITIYKNPNNIVTQYGLYVKDIGSEYFGLVPNFMTKSLREWGGIAIDLPKGVELTRSRQDIANKDKVSDILNPEIQNGLVEAYIKGFKQKMEEGEARFPFEELPYDYFSEGERYNLPSSYMEDADALINGKALKHVSEYVESGNALKFMTLLPLFEVNDQTISLDTIRRAFLSEEKKFPFDKEDWEEYLPHQLVSLLKKQKEERGSRELMRAEAAKDAIDDRTLEGIFKLVKGDLKEWMEENRTDLELVENLTKEFISAVNKSFGKTSEGLFYFSRTGEIAHARRGGDLSWNLDTMKNNNWYSALREIKKFKGLEKKEKGNKIDDLMASIGVLAHEYGHVVESFSAWTHDPRHDTEQARVLIQFLVQNGPQKMLESLRVNIEKELLKKINDQLSALGIDEEWVKAPESLPEYHTLKGKNVLMVDDVKEVLANNLPEYIVATGGSASALYHTEQSLTDLVSEIMSKNPDVVLMDFSLAKDIKGTSVIEELKNKDFKGRIVGHSAEDRKKEFQEAGVYNLISKGTSKVSDSVKELAKHAQYW